MPCPRGTLPVLLALLVIVVCLAISGGAAWPSWKCVGCQAGAEALRLLYETNATASRVLSAARFVCRHFADQDAAVCGAITRQFRAEFLYVLGRLVFSPGQLCGLLVANCGTPLHPFDANWTIWLPPMPVPPPVPPPPSPQHPARPLRILQLSDLHVDLHYEEGAEADCEEPVCCGAGDNRTRIRHAAGKWGTLANCDVPLRTVEHMLEHIQRNHEVDLLLLSGDYMDHRDWEYTRAGHLSQLDQITTLIRRHFPDTPAYWTLGNHEGVPVNAFAPHFVPTQFGPRWMYRAMLAAGNRTARLPADVRHSALYRGSYTIQLRPGLRLVSLNNGYCDRTNLFIYINQTDPDGTLSWLVDQLWKAERANESVYILAHIPPGDNECLESWSRNYYRIVIRFAATIAAQFFGHAHTDSFSVFYADPDNASAAPVSVLFSAPSVTTYPALNPAYRIYTAEPETGRIIDFETHFLNLSAISPGQPPKWELLYSARAEYSMPDMGAESWNVLIRRLEREPKLARKFNRNYARRDDAPPCDARCMTQRVCAMRAAHHNTSALCGSGRWGSGMKDEEDKERKMRRDEDEEERKLRDRNWTLREVWKWLAASITTTSSSPYGDEH